MNDSLASNEIIEICCRKTTLVNPFFDASRENSFDNRLTNNKNSSIRLVTIMASCCFKFANEEDLCWPSLKRL
jgi:hypothetical protein